MPFSLTTLRATGEAFPIAEGVGDASLATDGTLVVVDVLGDRGQQLVWRDRAGKKLGEIGRPQARIGTPSMSPDGRLVAVSGYENLADAGDIWLYHVDRAVSQRLTVHITRDAFPAWSPNGEQVAFQADRQGGGDLFVHRTDGRGDPRALTDSPGREAGSDWSPDGQRLIYGLRGEADFDLWLLSLGANDEKGQTKPFLATTFGERRPQISPDGRYVAYCSDESGRFEVYVRKFPSGEGRWQISEQGGGQPRWSHDGKELFYVEGNTLVAAAVSARPVFQVGKVERLFEDPHLSGTAWDYDVSADGRFVMVEDVVDEGEEQRKPAIRIIQNWYEEFRGREQD